MTAPAPLRSQSQEIQAYEELPYSGTSTSTSDLSPPGLTLIGGPRAGPRMRAATIDLSSALYGEVTSLPISNVGELVSRNIYWASAPRAGHFVNVFLSKAKSPTQVSFDLGSTGEHVAYVFIPEPVIQNEISALVELSPTPHSWVELASRVFRGSRNMTMQERHEFNALKAPLTKPLSKPLKKHPPR